MIKKISKMEACDYFRGENFSDSKSDLFHHIKLCANGIVETNGQTMDASADLNVELNYSIFDACMEYLFNCGIGFYKIQKENIEE